MKANWLIILMFLFVTSAFNISDLISFDTPSIKIKDVNIIKSNKGKVICYTINLYSPSQIKMFVAKPNVITPNTEKETKFEFNKHTRRATVTYYYALPEFANENEISIKFCLNDNKKQIDSIIYPFKQ